VILCCLVETLEMIENKIWDPSQQKKNLFHDGKKMKKEA